MGSSDLEVQNENLQDSLKVAKNLIEIQLEDKLKALKSEYDNMENGEELKLLQRKSSEISRSYQDVALQNEKKWWDIFVALQQLVIVVDPDKIDNDGCGCHYGMGIKDGIIRMEDAFNFGSVEKLRDENGWWMSVEPRKSMFPWYCGNGYYTKIDMIGDDRDVFDNLKAYKDKMESINDEYNTEELKLKNSGDVIKRVETEMMMDKLKANNAGSALISVGSLVDKYMNGGSLGVPQIDVKPNE